MRFDIRYHCRFAYDAPVSESQNELRAAPATTPWQQVLHYRVVTHPSARIHSHTDYWGTRVDTFGVRAPHESLEVTAESTVETSPRQPMAGTARRQELEEPGFVAGHLEYLSRSPHVDWGSDVAAEAHARAELAGDDVVGAALSIHRFAGTSLSYSPGSTYVGVGVDDVFARREGVCQDFAHLVIAMCRAVGIPARYVSGYLFARSEATGDDPGADEVEVATHAWVEAAIPGAGWLALDPTNGQYVGPRHIEIGHGRDYDDVAPLTGVYLGSATHGLTVGVHMRRMQQQQQQQ